MEDTQDIGTFDDTWDRAMSSSAPTYVNNPERIRAGEECVAHLAVRISAMNETDAVEEVAKLRKLLEAAGADVTGVGWGRRFPEPSKYGTANVSGEPVRIDDTIEGAT